MMNANYVVHGNNCVIQPGSVIGYKYKEDCRPVTLGDNCYIRIGTIIYADVLTGDDFQTGHNVMIRERTTFGNHIVVGTNTVIDGNVKIDDFVKIETNCYIPTHVTIGKRVFIGPGVVMTNDRYPQKMRDEYKPEGPVLEDGVTIGGGEHYCPGHHNWKRFLCRSRDRGNKRYPTDELCQISSRGNICIASET